MKIMSEKALKLIFIFNPRHSARVTAVVLCIFVSACLSVTKLAATYLDRKSKLRCYNIMVPYGVPNVWISLKTLCSPVLVSFADGKLLDFSPSGTFNVLFI